MSMFRFVHAADIHLDSPLRGLSGQEGDNARRIRKATREAFENLVTRSIEEKVDFMILSGDLYDGDWKDYQTGLFFVAQMGRLSSEDIPVFLVYGNHDAASQMTRSLNLPPNVNLFGTHHAHTFLIPDLSVAIHGMSFRQRDVTDNLVPGFPDPVPDMFNIGVLHTGLGGLGGHANYAPCSSGELIAKGYDYWALGHVHQGQVINRTPYIVFPGNLQGRHIRETGPKGACIISVNEGAVADLGLLAVDVVRWEVLTVNAGPEDSFSDIINRIREEIRTVSGEMDGRLLACRILIEGKTKIHFQLESSREPLLAEARSAALSLGSSVAWVERVVVQTEPMGIGVDEKEETSFMDLAQILGKAKDDPELLKMMESQLGELVQTLPYDLRIDNEDIALKSAIDREYGELLSPVIRFLLADIREQGQKS